MLNVWQVRFWRTHVNSLQDKLCPLWLCDGWMVALVTVLLDLLARGTCLGILLTRTVIHVERVLFYAGTRRLIHRTNPWFYFSSDGRPTWDLSLALQKPPASVRMWLVIAATKVKHADHCATEVEFSDRKNHSLHLLTGPNWHHKWNVSDVSWPKSELCNLSFRRQ